MDFSQISLDNININWIAEKVTTYGVKILTALLIVVVGFWIVSKISKLIRHEMAKTNLTISLKKVVGDVISILMKVLVVLIAMNTAGMEITSLVALLGGLAVGVGLALQGSLANFAGGILVLSFKPYKVGDFIESEGKSGFVTEISLLQTKLLTYEKRTIILPNGSTFNNPIENYSSTGIRRVTIGIGIGYDDNFEVAQKLLLQVFADEPLILEENGYVVEIDEFGDNSVNLAMFAYAKTDDYKRALWNVNSATKKTLDANGFNIPYPQRDVHIITK